jgi:hypothetical protein
MCFLEYYFEYHILYDTNSLISKILAYLYFKFYTLKAFLRAKNINNKIHKLTYLLKNKKTQSTKYELTELEILPNINGLTEINNKAEPFSFLNKFICDYLYVVSKHRNEIKVYSVNDEINSHIIYSESLIQKIIIIKN